MTYAYRRLIIWKRKFFLFVLLPLYNFYSKSITYTTLTLSRLPKKKNSNNFAALSSIITGLAPIDSAWKRASGIINLVRERAILQKYTTVATVLTENTINCQRHTFSFPCIWSPRHCLLAPDFRLDCELMWLRCRYLPLLASISL